MNCMCSKSSLRLLTIIVAGLIVMLLAAAPLQAQMGSSNRRPGGLTGRDRDINDREAQISNLERQRHAGLKRDRQAIRAEVNEDFNRLRVVVENMRTSLSSNAPLDYKYVADSSSEVKKRAARLKTNLILPDPKVEKRQKMQVPGDLTPAFTMLERFLNSFLTNPIFSASGDPDALLAGNAKLDLDRIIEISDKLRKTAEKIGKTP